jgi:hypothetical protein
MCVVSQSYLNLSISLKIPGAALKKRNAQTRLDWWLEVPCLPSISLPSFLHSEIIRGGGN